ncbi:amidase [Saccharospirillum sp.]|uniref:amidase n=1 Tax=Saccharospirillum sp. TaxID=2033801 RepID=UPI0034A0413E
MTHPCDLSIAEVGLALRRGALSAVELAQAHLDRIEHRNERLHAFIDLDPDDVLQQARAADVRLAAGDCDDLPLLGIPVALKDILDVAGRTTTCGSHAQAGHNATVDATVVQRIYESGVVFLGKVATYEFALTGPAFDQPNPPPRNPWNTGHITGGSSSGSAAAVAGGLVRCALGTDTGGSVRSPAAYCGIVGLKPTYERLSRQGVFPLSDSLDHVGPLAACVADAAYCFDAFSEPADAPPAAQWLGQGLAGLRLGYGRDWFAADAAVDPQAIVAIDAAVSQLSLLEARVETVELPDYDLFEAVGTIILQAEALAVHQTGLSTRPEHYGRAALRNLITGAALTPEHLSAARAMQQRLSADMDAILNRVDALITLTTLTPAPAFAAFTEGKPVWTPMRTFPFNLTGHPALTIPIGFSSGLPLGMQIIGKRNDEARICQIGHAFEQSTDHSVQKPVF